MNGRGGARTIERKIRRLTKEIAAIEQFFYALEEKDDRAQYAGMLERKRDDVVRGIVLQIHTAIEDILNTAIVCRVLDVAARNRMEKIRSKRGLALRHMLHGAGSLGFDMKLNFAVALGLMTSATKKQLMELNTLRNKCSHNWLLQARVRRGKRPGQRKPPLLLYQGRDLHNVAVFKDFMGEFGAIYAKMFLKYL